VALNDGFCIVIFGITYGIMNGLVGGGGHLSPLTIVGHPLIEILGSLAFGALLALVLYLLLRLVKGRSGALVVALGMVCLCSGIATMHHLSPLLANMALGFTLGNISRKTQLVSGSIQGIEAPIFVAFFTIAGAELNLHLLAKIGLLGGLYFLSRILGKTGGAGIGARLSQAPKTVQRYLGLGLVPQAGVAIGLTLLVGQNPDFAAYGSIITNTVLATVALNELIGPFSAKLAFIKSGEAFKR
jgi:Kef-type K+ transport system membrane component KefB